MHEFRRGALTFDVIDRGPDDGPPVVLLHGLGVSGSVLQPFARRLLPELAAIVPDLRGHGDSDAPPHGYLPADYAADCAA